jgi:uncharacterized protein (DUF305 family)
MIDHHRQAIEMSRAVLQHGKDPQLRQRAQKIIDDSQMDIAVLQKWATSKSSTSDHPHSSEGKTQ